MKGKTIFLALLLCFIGVSGFFFFKGSSKKEIIIFHAGSLAYPLHKLEKEFNKKYPEYDVKLEAAGSRVSARKISELGKQCDIMFSADREVVEQILIPKFADWQIDFSTNSLVIAYNDKSKSSKDISMSNWYSILKNKNVKTGMSNPNNDPCGYRTLLMLKLADKFYNDNSIFNVISKDNKPAIRSKEIDLLGLLDTNNVDYIFIYKSMAKQHHLKFIELPGEINLGLPEFNKKYKSVYTEINSENEGEMIKQYGSTILYSFTVPKNAKNLDGAKKFLSFMFSKEGKKVFDDAGQSILAKPIIEHRSNTPDEIAKLV